MRMNLTNSLHAIILCIIQVISVHPVGAGNFNGVDQELMNRAESARSRSALFWTGAQLPGDWHAPCPISVKLATHAGSGRTSFQFTNGEVHSWSMHVEGTREAIIEDVIPHEVDHMVRASLVRTPIVRWLDEGCATLFESKQTHAKLRKVAFQCDASLLTETWFTSQEYPTDMQDLVQLYAVGFSLTEFLLERDTPQILLQLQRESNTIESSLQQLYGLTFAQLKQAWRLYNQTHNAVAESCDENCPMHHALRPAQCDCQQAPMNLLEVWGATWCGPCRKFKSDYLHDTTFRDLLNKQFHIHFYDFDQQRSLAVQSGILAVPSFKWSGGCIQGYTTAENLMKQLKLEVLPFATPLTIPSEQIPERSTLPGPSTTSDPRTRIPSAPLQDSIFSHEQTVIYPASSVVPSSGNRQPTATHIPAVVTSKPATDKHWSLFDFIHQVLPMSLTALQWSGIIGGSIATGGIGGVALTALVFLLKRHNQASQTQEADRRGKSTDAPFPRKLDEARQLLELRKSEGRVAILDALRGMFLDDELEKIKQDQAPEVAQQFDKLRSAIDVRVEEVAPLSTAVQ